MLHMESNMFGYHYQNKRSIFCLLFILPVMQAVSLDLGLAALLVLLQMNPWFSKPWWIHTFFCL